MSGIHFNFHTELARIQLKTDPQLETFQMLNDQVKSPRKYAQSSEKLNSFIDALAPLNLTLLTGVVILCVLFSPASRSDSTSVPPPQDKDATSQATKGLLKPDLEKRAARYQGSPNGDAHVQISEGPHPEKKKKTPTFFQKISRKLSMSSHPERANPGYVFPDRPIFSPTELKGDNLLGYKKSNDQRLGFRDPRMPETKREKGAFSDFVRTINSPSAADGLNPTDQAVLTRLRALVNDPKKSLGNYSDRQKSRIIAHFLLLDGVHEMKTEYYKRAMSAAEQMAEVELLGPPSRRPYTKEIRYNGEWVVAVDPAYRREVQSAKQVEQGIRLVLGTETMPTDQSRMRQTLKDLHKLPGALNMHTTYPSARSDSKSKTGIQEQGTQPARMHRSSSVKAQ